MADKASATKGITPDWLVRGILTKVGDIFDRLTGRGWKPSSTLATSELIERLKALLDAEVREDTPGCRFVPNNIKLKMQWDKFSTDSERDLKRLEAEMLAAIVDHINDRRYFTHAPLALEVKPDYFTPGVRLLVSFDQFAGDENHEAGINLSVPGADKTAEIDAKIQPHKPERKFIASYLLNRVEMSKALELVRGSRLSVGRTKENDLAINDQSISKIHASLTVDNNGMLIVSDTGSTNGTFVGDERIGYGKTALVGENGTVKFGAVDVTFKFEHIPRPAGSFASVEETLPFQPRDLIPSAKNETVAPLNTNNDQRAVNAPSPAPSFEPAPTEASIPAPTLPSIQPAEEEKS